MKKATDFPPWMGGDIRAKIKRENARERCPSCGTLMPFGSPCQDCIPPLPWRSPLFPWRDQDLSLDDLVFKYEEEICSLRQENKELRREQENLIYNCDNAQALIEELQNITKTVRGVGNSVEFDTLRRDITRLTGERDAALALADRFLKRENEDAPAPVGVRVVDMED